jgi:hypothetical protein
MGRGLAIQQAANEIGVNIDVAFTQIHRFSHEVSNDQAAWFTWPNKSRWVYIREPQKGSFHATPAFILDCFLQRWQMEVTPEEARAHMSLETQRQCSDKAIACATPCLLELYSIVTLLTQPLFATGQLPVRALLGMPNHRLSSPTRMHPCAAANGVTNIFQPRCTSTIW